MKVRIQGVGLLQGAEEEPSPGGDLRKVCGPGTYFDRPWLAPEGYWELYEGFWAW